MKIIVKYIALILLWQRIDCQNETKKWYFGFNAGIDFMTNPPSVISGSLVTSEGCASMADAAGNLLFYSNGLTVWNKFHNVMANGTGLMGDFSTTQSCLFIKQPGNVSLYYVFTLDNDFGQNGYRYSVVDMSLAAGAGSVTIKNVAIHTPSCEKLAAVRHCNGVDVWVITHDMFSDTFRVNLLTSAGFGMTPVLTKIGPAMMNAYDDHGQMKVSPNGRKLGFASMTLNNGLPGFQIYDFDASSGIISNYFPLGNITYAYGCEFSRDGTKFYGTRAGGAPALFQWDLCAGSPSAVVASQYSTTSTNTNTTLYALQLASDNRIYIARPYMNYVSAISNPGVSGAGCGFTEVAQSTGAFTSQGGLPGFMSSYFRQPPVVDTGIVCGNVSFSLNPGCSAVNYSITGLSWNFGDPGAGAGNISTLWNPTHQYGVPGNYTTTVIAYYPCGSDTVRIPLVITTVKPSLGITGSQTICVGESCILTASGGDSFSWTVPGGGTLSAATITQTPAITTQYTVTATNTLTGCKATKTVSVLVSKCMTVGKEGGNAGVRLWPNPIKASLNVETIMGGKLYIRNSMGVILRSQILHQGLTQVLFEDLPLGIYLVSVEQGTNISRHTILKLD